MTYSGFDQPGNYSLTDGKDQVTGVLPSWGSIKPSATNRDNQQAPPQTSQKSKAPVDGPPQEVQDPEDIAQPESLPDVENPVTSGQMLTDGGIDDVSKFHQKIRRALRQGRRLR